MLGRETVDQRQRGEGQGHAPVALGPGQAVDNVLIVDEMETFKRNGRAGTIAQQPLQASAQVGPARQLASGNRNFEFAPGRDQAGLPYQ